MSVGALAFAAVLLLVVGIHGKVDTSFEEYVKTNNIKLVDMPIPHNSIDLWEQNFDEKVSQGKWVIFFWVNWSPGSRRLHSIWEEFTFQGLAQYPHLQFARVDCGSEKSLCKDRFNITKYPHIVGISKNKMVKMTESESNDGLHEFVKVGWAKRGPGKRVPPIPNPYYLKYQARPYRFVNGLEPVFGVPLSYLVGGVATAFGSLILLVGYFACVICCDRGTPDELPRKPSPSTSKTEKKPSAGVAQKVQEEGRNRRENKPRRKNRLAD